MLTGLEALFLEVNNLEESLSFYHERLGCEIESHTPAGEPPIATLRAGALKISLVQQLETMLKRGRGVHFVMGVDDVDALFHKLSSEGNHVAPPRDDGWGRFVTLQDPDGYRLFFVNWKSNDA